MVETDVINHLIDIEREAAEILLEAQEKADEITNSAKNEAEAEFKAGYEAVVRECEDDFKTSCSRITEEYEGILTEYQDRIKSSARDVKGFNSLLDNLLFGA